MYADVIDSTGMTSTISPGGYSCWYDLHD